MTSSRITAFKEAFLDKLTDDVSGSPRDAMILNDGRVAVFWQDPETQGGALRHRLYDMEGNPVSAETVTAVTPADTADAISIYALYEGGFRVMWANPEGSETQMSWRQFDADGAPQEIDFEAINPAHTPDLVDAAFKFGLDRVTATLAPSTPPAGTTGDLLYIEDSDYFVMEMGDRVPLEQGLFGTSGDDVLAGSSGDDDIFGLVGNDSVSGGAGADDLFGGAGSDTLDGGAGADELIGGDGNDTYVMGRGDTIIEEAGGGVDTVTTATSLTLGANLENLVLTESAASNGSGNALANMLSGNGAANSLNGEGGNDRLNGGNGADMLDGGAGRDMLTGGGGADSFVFDTALRAGTADRITDFNVKADTIMLDDAVFRALAEGWLNKAAFVTNTSGNAADASDRMIYESDTGEVWYDRDGTGSASKVHVATLDEGLSITHSDFFVF